MLKIDIDADITRLIKLGITNPDIGRHIIKDVISDVVINHVAKISGLQTMIKDQLDEMALAAKLKKEADDYADKRIDVYRKKYARLQYDFDAQVIKTSKRMILDTLMQHLETDGNIHEDCDGN